MPTNYNVIEAFIESEFRATALMAQLALSEIRSDQPSAAREHLMKARLCFMAALLHLRHGDTQDERARADANRLDDALREIERLLEQTGSPRSGSAP